MNISSKILLLIMVLGTLSACSNPSSSTSPSSTPPLSSSSGISSASSSSIPSSSSVVEYDLASIAEVKRSVVVEENKPYPLRPSGGMSIIGANYSTEFDVGTEVLKNVVSIEVFGDYNMVKAFMTDYGYSELFATDGSSFSMLASGVYRNRAEDRLFILFYGEKGEDLSTYKYVSLGGFESDKIGSAKVMIEII